MIRTHRRRFTDAHPTRQARSAARRRSRSLAPHIEGLEDRVVLSTITWNTTVAPTGGDWDTTSNWDRERRPRTKRPTTW